MRLTLRTMLAYLDDVLDPPGAQELGMKIRESEFATGLADRIRTVTKKLRIDAPKLDGKGMGNDPNTVAEYLDSTLPQDRVGDFERICLESDKHLCEVAACHQVLTLVLGKPAQVPMELRERVYALGHPEKAPPIPTHTTPPAGEVAAPPVAGNGKPSADVPAPLVVPDYLRAGRRTSVLPLVAASAIVLLILLGILRLMGPFDRTHPLAQMVAGPPREVAQAPDATNEDDLQPPVIVTPDRTSEDASPDTAQTAEEATERTTATPDATPDKTPDTTPDTPPDTAPAPQDVADAAAVPAPDTTEMPDTPDDPAAAVKPEVAADDARPAPADPAADRDPADAAPAVASLPRVRPPAAPSVEPAESPLDVGRYTSDAQVLAALDPATRLWHVKPPRAVLMAGERLAVIPPYRPQIALPSGVQVTFAGESAVTMGRPAETGASHLQVDWGRFLVVTVGAAGAQLDLSLAGTDVMDDDGMRFVPHVAGLLTLVDADSSVAVRVSRWLSPGTDPEEEGSIPVIEIFGMHGRVAWQERGEAESATIPPRHLLVYLGDQTPEIIGPLEPPEWIDARSISAIESRAAMVLDDTYLRGPKTLNVSLREATQDRRVEVRSLAARCLAFLGDFEPILRELSDTRQVSFWTPAVESLRQAVAAGPPSAAAVREAIERLRPAQARELYRLLWGYSQEQLDGSAAAQLVRHLENEQIDVRVLTFHNLVQITGAHEFYRPERSPANLRVPIQNWKQRLDRNTIAWRTAPSPLLDYKPLAEAAPAPPPRAAPPAATPLATPPAAAPPLEAPPLEAPPADR